MYIVLVSSTGRKGPLAQRIEAQILGLYMAHFLGLVSLIVCVCVFVCMGFACLCVRGLCVRAKILCVYEVCTCALWGLPNNVFVFISPARIPRGHSDFE